MRVLLALLEARGEVVTRAILLKTCWDGQFVGEDALNRAIGEVRRVARTIAAGDFVIETIPRTGYRLDLAVTDGVTKMYPGDANANGGAPVELAPVADRVNLPRRSVIVGIAAGAGTVALARWWVSSGSGDGRQAELVAAGDSAMRQSLPHTNMEAASYYRQAAALEPDNAQVWGKLALALQASAEFAAPAGKAAAVTSCELAAGRALAIDPSAADALAALALLQPYFGDWLAAERRFRRVLAIAPYNEAARAALAVLLQSVGRTRAASTISPALADRAALSPRRFYGRTYALWNMGRVDEADRNIDRAMELWPRHPAIWFTRMWLLAMTDRADAALAMVDDEVAWPLSLTVAHAAELRVSMRALASRETPAIRTAVARNREMVMQGPSWAIHAIMILTRLGALDDAFDVANGYLLRAGPLVGKLRHSAAQPSLNDQRQRKTMMLFIPPTSPLRADPRFLPLCEAMGMADYWRQSRTSPDFLARATT